MAPHAPFGANVLFCHHQIKPSVQPASQRAGSGWECLQTQVCSGRLQLQETEVTVKHLVLLLLLLVFLFASSPQKRKEKNLHFFSISPLTRRKIFVKFQQNKVIKSGRFITIHYTD